MNSTVRANNLDETGTATSPAAPLALVDVERRFKQLDGELTVLDGANLTIGDGEMVALVAPSGAGKSTLLQIAGLLEKPDAGEVYIAGRSCGKANDETRTLLRRLEIGFVYQFHHLLPEFDALENLVLPQMIRGMSTEKAQVRALQVMEYLNIDHRSTHRPTELSGGEQQRVAIARAVINGPRVLLADEPTGNLDPDTASHVFEALMGIVRGSGLGALVATHNMELAAKMDRRVTLRDGKIVEF